MFTDSMHLSLYFIATGSNLFLLPLSQTIHLSFSCIVFYTDSNISSIVIQNQHVTRAKTNQCGVFQVMKLVKLWQHMGKDSSLLCP